MHFNYKPLPEGNGEWIRILRLFAGKAEDSIVCELLLTNLRRSHFRKTPKYEAVSYVWGDPNRVQEITCEGLPLFITINLYQALRRFRCHDQSRLLWADGICIDQQNDVEKGNQVSMMGQIYEQSNCTLIWLGEVDHFPCEDRCSSCVEDAISLIRDFNCYFESQYAKLNKSRVTDVVRDIHAIPPVPEDHWLRNETKKWECLRALLSRPWSVCRAFAYSRKLTMPSTRFSRVWVLQEVGLSQCVVAFAGKLSLSFSDLALFVLVYDSTAIVPKSDSLPTGRIMDAFWSIWSTFGRNTSWMNEKSAVKKYAHEMKRRYGTDSNAAILILCAGRQFEASEDRDHIYAFLGHPALRGIIKPDYGAALEDVCLALAQKLLSSGCSLNMLTFVDNSDDDLLRSEDRQPSWVPKWHTALTYRRYPHERWMLREINSIAHETIINVSGSRLHIAALLVDTVDGCTQALGGPLGDIGVAATESQLGQKVQQLWKMFCDSRQKQRRKSGSNQQLPLCIHLDVGLWVVTLTLLSWKQISTPFASTMA